ncbi:DNA-binding domain-containing protein [Pseudorhodobacter ferrugineus]|uniref:HvfC/BufC N-terminal domain-containing protein n=1 Tax=Pseudorhodobacter ferrugineus TaxID=77008 RepID=UPI0003B3AE5E|nr:DNA-binding domain-containing protein [Pseudorhodobacter ferrugineus]
MMQEGFVKALLNSDLPVPEGLIDSMGRPAGRRFSVYRNNVAGSLTEALRASFPVLEKLLGAEYFAALAGVFLRAHPPTSRMMMLYGTEMPAFLEGFVPLAHLPYLADVARLEQARRETYHASDSTVDAAALAIAPERFLAARLVLAPPVRVVRSRYPVVSIWRANAEDGPAPMMQSEDALVLRNGYDPSVHLLPQGGAAFVAALQAGKTVEAGMDAAGDAFDLAAMLALLIGNNGIAALEEDL